MEAGTDIQKIQSYGGAMPVFDRPWAKKVVAAAREKTFAKADAGSEIHDILEQYFADYYANRSNQDTALCDSVHKSIAAVTKSQSWIPERSFANAEHGYAGKCDLHSPDWVIDFKTKDGSVEKVRGYQNQAEQLAAYAVGLGIPNARLANVFISRDRELWGKPEGVSFFEHKDDNAWNRFKAQLDLWQITKKFGPAYDRLNK